MKARCKHGAPWFRDDCPECLSEQDYNTAGKEMVVATFPMWRFTTREEAITYMRRVANSEIRKRRLIAQTQALMDRAIDALFQ